MRHKPVMRWAVIWRAGPNNVDKKVIRHVCWVPHEGYANGPALFYTRRAARAWAKKTFGYITARRDLRRYPHDWKPPLVVRVALTIQEIA